MKTIPLYVGLRLMGVQSGAPYHLVRFGCGEFTVRPLSRYCVHQMDHTYRLPLAMRAYVTQCRIEGSRR